MEDKEGANAAVAEKAEASVASVEEKQTVPGEKLVPESELAKAKQEAEKWRSEALAHQRTASKKDTELKQYKDTLTRLDTLDQKFTLLAESLALKEDTEPEDEYEAKPKRKPQNNVITKLREIDQRQSTSALEKQKQVLVQAANEAQAMITPLGLDMQKSPELRAAYALFRAGDIEDALEETKRVVSQVAEAKKGEKQVKTETPEEIEKRIREDERKRVYAEKGWNISDPGGGSGGKHGLTVEDVKKMSPEEYNRRVSEIALMPLNFGKPK